MATITSIRQGKLTIHFDGWTNYYDYQCEPSFKEIHPIGWCSQHKRALQEPNSECARTCACLCVGNAVEANRRMGLDLGLGLRLGLGLELGMGTGLGSCLINVGKP